MYIILGLGRPSFLVVTTMTEVFGTGFKLNGERNFWAETVSVRVTDTRQSQRHWSDNFQS